MLPTISSIVFAEIPEKLSALQMFFGLFSIAFDRKSGSEAEKKGDVGTPMSFIALLTKAVTPLQQVYNRHRR